MTDKGVRLDPSTGRLRAGRPEPYIATSATDSTGRVTFTLPGGYFTSVLSAIPVVVRNTAAPASFAFAFVVTQSATSVVVQVAESKTTGVLILNTTVEGLEASGAGITVTLTVHGI